MPDGPNLEQTLSYILGGIVAAIVLFLAILITCRLVKHRRRMEVQRQKLENEQESELPQPEPQSAPVNNNVFAITWHMNTLIDDLYTYVNMYIHLRVSVRETPHIGFNSNVLIGSFIVVQV